VNTLNILIIIVVSQGAIKDVDKAIELTPDFADVYYIRGNAKAQMGNMDNACLDWSKAGELGYSKAYERIKENCN
jgi:tetratricopeptide (TPR) repeat protein